MTKVAMDCKELMVKEISESLKSDTLIVTNYKGLSAQDLNELRRELRNISGKYLVVKDSMIKRAIGEDPSKGIATLIEGAVGIAIDRKEEPSYISKILVKFAKDHEFLKICGGIMNGELITKDDIKELASLPSREAMLGKLANVLNAPIQGLAVSLNAIICKFLYALNAVKDKKPKEEVKAEEPKKEEVKPQEEVKKEEVLSEQKEETPQVEAVEEPKLEAKEEIKPENVKPENKEDLQPKEDKKEEPQAENNKEE